MPSKPAPKPTKSSRPAKNLGLVRETRTKRFTLVGTALLMALVGVYVVFQSFAAVEAAGSVPVPTSGLYWGGTNSGDNNATVPGCPMQADTFAVLECKVGWAAQAQGLSLASTPYHSTMEHFYLDCGDSDAKFTAGSNLWTSAHANGRRLILLSLHCGSTWSKLASHDPATVADLRHKIDLTSQLGVPVLLVFHHEPEDDSCMAPSGKSFGTPDEYRAASQVFSTVVRDEQNRLHHQFISIGWTLMTYTFAWPTSQNKVFTGCGMANVTDAIRTPANWYPGDGYVDWITPDVYVRSTHSFYDTFKPVYDWSDLCPAVHPATSYSCSPALKRTKPLGIAETGVSADLPVASRVADIDEMRTVPAARFPKLKLIAWWGQDGVIQNNVIDLPLSDTAHRVLKAYAKTELALKVRFLQ